jgi:hypothetical protein
MYRTLVIACFLVTVLFSEVRSQRVDSYPEEVANRLTRQLAAEKSTAPKLDGDKARFIFSNRRWQPGSKLLVAFNGGTPTLHRAIADEAAKWTQFANVVFDFGVDANTGAYRKWSPADEARVAHIRIGFSDSGYWSYVGTDSVGTIAPLNEPTMNFQGFAESWPYLMPDRWASVVIHEFGHALGMHHEHQHQTCAQEFRWERGPNGEPSIYDVFYYWQRWKAPTVDLNVRPVSGPNILSTATADKQSIMFYSMPAQAYINGKNSPCFIPRENATFSAGDIQGARRAYPSDPTQAAALELQFAQAAAELSSQAQPSFTVAEQNAVSARVQSLTESQKPLLYIHIQRESDRGLARRIQQSGRAAGFFVPGIENVSRKGLKTGPVPQVRYFRNVDADYASAALKLVAEASGRDDVAKLQIKHLARRVNRNLIEIWLP